MSEMEEVMGFDFGAMAAAAAEWDRV